MFVITMFISEYTELYYMKTIYLCPKRIKQKCEIPLQKSATTSLVVSQPLF